MLRSITLLLLLSFCATMLLSCGGKDTHMSIAEEMAGEFEGVVTILKDITDEASAKEAKADLEKVADKMKALAERAKDLGPADEETKRKVGGTMMGAFSGLFSEMARVDQIPGGTEALTAFNEAISSISK